MNGEYDRLRQLLLEQERDRMDALQDSVHQATTRFERVPDLLAEDIERSLQDGKRSRLANVLAEATADSLEMAVRRKPQAVVQAVYPVIGPAIRRSLSDALRPVYGEQSLGMAMRWALLVGFPSTILAWLASRSCRKDFAAAGGWGHGAMPAAIH